MNQIRRLILIFPVFILTLSLFTVTTAEETKQKTIEGKKMKTNHENWSPAQRGLWQREQAYWQRLKDGDLDGLQDFYHENFVGWPSHSVEPVSRMDAAKSLQELFLQMKILSYELRPYQVMIHQKIAIIHYHIQMQIQNSAGEKTPALFRITHTWLNEEGTWRILGGMSAK